MGHTTYTWDAERYCDAFPIDISVYYDRYDRDWIFFKKDRCRSNWYRGSWDYILCSGKSQQWWDLKDVKKIRIILTSDKNRCPESAYLCQKSKRALGNIRIRSESNGRWYEYDTFSTMYEAIELMLKSHKEWFLAIEELVE